jgi:hypothetical protein
MGLERGGRTDRAKGRSRSRFEPKVTSQRRQFSKQQTAKKTPTAEPIFGELSATVVIGGDVSSLVVVDIVPPGR